VVVVINQTKEIIPIKMPYKINAIIIIASDLKMVEVVGSLYNWGSWSFPLMLNVLPN
jgi:hypothetical protein